MNKEKKPNVLRVVVVTDDLIVEDLHQRQPGSLRVGRVGANDVHIYDEIPRATDHAKYAKSKLLVGGLMVLFGVIQFVKDVMSHARLVQQSELEGFVLTNAEAIAQVGGLGVWSLIIALAGMVPLISAVTALLADPTDESESESESESAPVFEPALEAGPRAADSLELFHWDPKRASYDLHIPAEADGTLVLGGKRAKVRSLREQQGDSKGNVHLTLPANAKGKLRMGESILVFKMVRPRKLSPGMVFPKALIDPFQFFRMDRMTFAVHLSVAVIASSFLVMLAHEEPTEPEASDRYLAEMNLVRYEVPNDDPKDEAQEEVEVEAVPELPTQERRIVRDVEKKVVDPKPEDTKVHSKRPATFSKAAVKEARGVGVARVLGTYGGEGEGAVLDIIGSTENDLGALFAMGMTQTPNADSLAVTAFVAGGEGISAHGAVVDTEGFTTGKGPAKIAAAKDTKRERKVKSRVQHSTDEVYGDVDQKLVKTVIRRRMGGLKACYEKALRTDPALKGRMSISFDISLVGRVTGIRVHKDTVGDAAVRSCVERKIESWRFPIEGGEEPAEVSFSVVFES